jgi:ketosteroid isomerase-like protein
MKKVLILCLAGLILTGCATLEKTRMEDFKESTIKNLETYGRALIEKDIETWLGLHDENVIKMPQDRTPLVGMQALREDITMGMKFGDILEFTANNEEFVVFGDYGYVRGNYSMESRLREGNIKMPRFEGKFLTVYKKQPDNSWKIYRDSYSSNLPPVQ